MKAERDQLAAELQNVELSFSDLHKRYDLMRKNAQVMRKNEALLREERDEKIRQLQDNVRKFNVRSSLIASV